MHLPRLLWMETCLIALCVPCAAQGQKPPEADPFAELLSTLPAIGEAWAESELIEIRNGDRTVGWGRMDIEAKPDASGGFYLLRERFVIQMFEGKETVSARLEAEVDARFRPRKVTIVQVVSDGKSTARSTDTLETTSNGFRLGHADDAGEPVFRMVGLPKRPFVVGIEYLLPRLPRDKLNGAVIVELDPQAGEVTERKVTVIGLPRGRASIQVKDVEGQGEREATYTVSASGRIDWIQQGTLVFSSCMVDRWEALRKKFPDVE